jgi:uncharacterized phage protein (TIGR02220 family)
MPSVRIEDDAFGDLRFEILATEAGLSDSDHARGKMIRLWRQCTAENVHTLPEAVVVSVLGVRGVSALIVARLGEKNSHGVRIKGTKGRIEWLENLRKNGRKGGRPTGSKTKTKREPSGFQEPNPLALVTATALVTAQGEGERAAKSPHVAPLVLVPTDPPAPCRDRAHELAEACCNAINAATGSRYRPDSDATRKLALALAKDRRTISEMEAVVADRVSAWLGDPKMAAYLRPATILAPRNFATYIDDLRSRAPGVSARASPATSRHAPASSIDATAQALRERGFE